MSKVVARGAAAGYLLSAFAVLVVASCSSSSSSGTGGGGGGGAGGGGAAGGGGVGGGSGTATICQPCRAEGDCVNGLICLDSPPFPGAAAQQGSYCTTASCASNAASCGQAAGNEITCVPLSGYAAGGVAQCVCGASALCRYCTGPGQCPTGYTCAADHYCTKACTTTCDGVPGVTVACVNSECQCGAPAADGGADAGGGSDASDAAPDSGSNDAEVDSGG